jgi:ADP-ribose pyrophosphatase YjhB (NUDIX family)
MSEPNPIWKPHVTVAAVIEKNQNFLMVEEQCSGQLVFNQPAGHLENGEDLITAIKREVLEETTCQFEPSALLAIQLWRKDAKFPTFLRVCFTGTVSEPDPTLPLDHGIIATHWLNRDDLNHQKHRLRSPLVLESVNQYLSGQRIALTLLKSLITV